MSAREVAADRCTVALAVPRRVLGWKAEDYEAARVTRVAQLRSALAALGAAVGSPRILAGEWGDAALSEAAVEVQHQLDVDLGTPPLAESAEAIENRRRQVAAHEVALRRELSGVERDLVARSAQVKELDARVKHAQPAYRPAIVLDRDAAVRAVDHLAERLEGIQGQLGAVPAA